MLGKRAHNDDDDDVSTNPIESFPQKSRRLSLWDTVASWFVHSGARPQGKPAELHSGSRTQERLKESSLKKKKVEFKEPLCIFVSPPISMSGELGLNSLSISYQVEDQKQPPTQGSSKKIAFLDNGDEFKVMGPEVTDIPQETSQGKDGSLRYGVFKGELFFSGEVDSTMVESGIAETVHETIVFAPIKVKDFAYVN